MKVGDLVDDGLDNIGFVVDAGFLIGNRGQRLPAILVHFADSKYNGWYEAKDLEVINE